MHILICSSSLWEEAMSDIIITGAGQGIGYYMAEKLLTDGNRVAVLDLYMDDLEDLKKRFEKLIACKVDLTDDEAVRQAICEIAETFGNIDIAIHNACQCTFKSEADTAIETYRDVFEVNYYGALRLVKSVAPYMIKQNGGKIIFTSSGVGVTGFMNISPYSSTKGALESLAKCLRLEYEKYGISFQIIHPPLTNTKSSSPLPVPVEFKADPKEVGYGLAKNLNSKRFIICHSKNQKMQTLGCYLFPLKMGALLSKLTAKAAAGE